MMRHKILQNRYLQNKEWDQYHTEFTVVIEQLFLRTQNIDTFLATSLILLQTEILTEIVIFK
jgi:hypothetical protein